MQDYERLINYFFTYCNVTITSPYMEKLLKKSSTEYSVLYILKSHPVEGYNKELVKFDFKEEDDSILMYVSYAYSDDKYGFSIDGSLLNKEMDFGRRSMLFFESVEIKHYCPSMCLNFIMNKKSKELLLFEVYQTINVFYQGYSVTLANFKEAVDIITNEELIRLKEDPTGMRLDDKLCLLAMAII